MSNFKLVKTAAALALGASVVTSAVATTDASAASKYKIKSGKLVYAKSGKVVKGYVTYKSTVYKNGSKLTGLKGKTYYKAGKKATGTYKGAYYVKGVKKVTTGTYNKAYYVKGVKKVSTGLYASKYYKDGKLATGTYKGAYYVKGLKKVTTGTYNGAYYVAGKKVVSTGLYKDQLYVSGKLNKGYKLYKEDLYKDAVLNKELALFEGKLYDGAKLNEGHKIFKDELYNGSELNKEVVLFEGKLYDGAKLNEGIKKFEDKWYNNAELADGTFTVEGVEKAFENGVEVGAKVKSVEAINATQVKVTFNKSVDKDTVINSSNGNVIEANATFTGIGDATTRTVSKAEVKDNVVIYTLSGEAAGEYTVAIDNLKTTGKENISRFAKVVAFEADKVAPTVVSTEKQNASTVLVKFSEPLSSKGTWTYVDETGATKTAQSTLKNDNTAVELVLESGNHTPSGTNLVFTGINVKDQALNLANPNPVKVDFTVGQKDMVAAQLQTVTQTGAKEFEITFNKAVKKEQVATAAADLVSVDGSVTISTVKPKTDGATLDTVYVVTTQQVLEGVKTVSTTAKFVNADGTPAAVGTKLVTFVKDITAPKALSTSITKVDGHEYLEVTFDKNVVITENTLGTSSIKFVGSYEKDGVNTTVDAAAAAVKYKSATDKKVVLVKLADLVSGKDVVNAKYVGTLTLAGIKSEADVPVTSATTEFTRGEDSVANTDKLALASSNGITQVLGSPNQIKVKFDKNVDVTTAKTLSNYTVAGATVTSATINSDALDTVILTIAPSTIAITAEYNVTIQNVKAKNSTVAMDSVTKPVSLKENVAPTISKVEFVAANVVKVTFSEIVGVATVGSNGTTVTPGTIAAANFEVKYNGEVVALDDTTPVATATTADTSVEANQGYKTVYLKLATPVTDTNKSLTVAAKDLVDVTVEGSTIDADKLIGNKISTTAVSK